MVQSLPMHRLRKRQRPCISTCKPCFISIVCYYYCLASSIVTISYESRLRESLSSNGGGGWVSAERVGPITFFRKNDVKPKLRLHNLDLHPTAITYESRRHFRDLLKESNASFVENTNIRDEDLRRRLRIKQRNGVYASIPDKDDPVHSNNRHLIGFYSTRHLSRYERVHRERNAMDLELNWDGTYVFGDDEEAYQPNITNINVNMTRGRALLQRHTQVRSYDTTTTNIRAITTSQLSSATFTGGQFNNFQDVPLSQGYGTHFANVWVGTPVPQRKTVIVDTGSHYTAFPCAGCNQCGGAHHTDPYFDPHKSKTFHTLQCDECKDGVVCEHGQCRFSQSYTEGSSWVAVQVQDRFYCGSPDILDSVDPDDEKYSLDFMFGCQISMTGLFITQLADGIMGMSAHSATLPKQLYDRKLIEHNMFALCYRRELGTSKHGVTAGSMTLGGYRNTLDTSPVVYAKNMANVGWFTVYVKGIYVRSGGGQSASSYDKKHQTIRVRVDPATLNSGKGVIVDSGTTDTYLNKAVAKEFSRAWKQATGKKYSHAPIRLTDEQLHSLPTILVQCHSYTQRVDPSIDDYGSIPGYAGRLDPKNPNDLLIAIPATSYMDYSPVSGQYTSRVYFTESSGGVLGSNAMQGHNVVFDWENGRIGFAESSCTYDKKNTPRAALDEGFSADCLLGNPILTQSCIDTVDKRLCKHHPNNIALLGTETWSAIVESAGTDSGSSCVESAKSWIVSNELDESVIQCQGDGLCTEKRPCQMACSEVEKASRVKQLPYSNEKCGDSFWSACDYGCTQSRIVSVPYSDGHCHEVSRETRPCHIGACARSDPCRVPFLVHAVIGFRGGSVANWSLASEDLFVSALTDASVSLSKTRLFDEGDVNVLGVLPWYKDEENEGWAQNPETTTNQHTTDELGFKVVAEISVFNALAKVRNSSVSEQSNQSLMQETGAILYAVLQNITDRLTLQEVKTVCRADDLYSLAKKALNLRKTVIHHASFMTTLISALKQKGDYGKQNHANSPFLRLQTNELFVDQSRLLAAWSIRTEVDDEINFFGPPKPWWFRLLAAAHAVAFLVMAFMLLTTAWTITLGCYDSFAEEASSPRPRLFGWMGRYRNFHFLYASGDHGGGEEYDSTETEDDVMASRRGGDLELTSQNKPIMRYGGTTPKKRRSTFYSQSSNDA